MGIVDNVSLSFLLPLIFFFSEIHLVKEPNAEILHCVVFHILDLTHCIDGVLFTIYLSPIFPGHWKFNLEAGSIVFCHGRGGGGGKCGIMFHCLPFGEITRDANHYLNLITH